VPGAVILTAVRTGGCLDRFLLGGRRALPAEGRILPSSTSAKCGRSASSRRAHAHGLRLAQLRRRGESPFGVTSDSLCGSGDGGQVASNAARPSDIQYDHVIPVVMGGATSVSRTLQILLRRTAKPPQGRGRSAKDVSGVAVRCSDGPHRPCAQAEGVPHCPDDRSVSSSSRLSRADAARDEQDRGRRTSVSHAAEQTDRFSGFESVRSRATREAVCK